MSLTSGTRVGDYRIGELIGRGGMGEVYSATDVKLKRSVAIKVLPESLSRDAEHLARFEREARILASLNHPNIASIFGLAEVEGGQALVLELVEGPTLSERLHRNEGSRARAGLPVREALAIALQLASALEAAHELGVVHRDLKPTNIKFTSSGEVKILDFGLAKAFANEPVDAEALSQSPTRVFPTTKGVILGTPAYMSPEQARGQAVDRRTDIWAFGVLLFEMLTGRPMFTGPTPTDILAAVIGTDPDWAALPVDTPVDIEQLMKRCLVHDARVRLRDIGEARVALDAENKSGPRVSKRRPHRVSRPWAWGGLGLVAFGLVYLLASFDTDAPANTATRVHAQIDLGEGHPLSFGMRPSMSLSPDGATLVVASQAGGASRLYARSLADTAVVPIAGTDDATGPFFSLDGEWIGFFAGGRLKKVSADGGGRPMELALAPLAQGASFTPAGGVVFSPIHGEGVSHVSATGGDARVVTTVDRQAGEAGHHWPHVLPDGEHVLVTVERRGQPYSEARIDIVSLRTLARHPLIEDASDARYVDTPGGARILFWRDGDLWAIPFQRQRLAVDGAPHRVLDGVMVSEANGFAEYAVSSNGALVYIDGRHPLEERSLVMFDRSGALRALTAEHRSFERPRVSPDGSRLAVSIEAANGSLWIHELERRTLSRLTFDHESNRAAWSPDGQRIAFASHAGGSDHRLVVAPIDGSAAETTLRESDRPEQPESWSADGETLLFTRRDSETGSDAWVLSLTSDPREARPFLSSRFEEMETRLSPSGDYVAYQSDETGRFEIYIRAFPGPGGKQQISVEGGTEPRWGRQGRELYYRRDEDLMSVELSAASPLRTSAPRKLFATRQLGEQSPALSSWDVLPDGSGFIMIQSHAEPRTALHLVLGWLEALPPSD